MYRLDLSDQRLILPRPISGIGGRASESTFSAPMRPGPGLVPVVVEASGRLAIGPRPGVEPRFYAVSDGAKGFEATRPLLEYETSSSEPVYAVHIPATVGMRETGRAIGRVWPPISRP